MERTTVRFTGDDADLYDLLQELADERDRSVNWLVVDAVRQVYGDADAHRSDVTPHRTDAPRIAPERIDAIEHRLDVIEERLAELDDVSIDDVVDEPPDDDRRDDLEGDDAISDALDGWEPGRAGGDRERRREAGRAAVEYVRDADEPVTASDVRDALTPEHLVGDEKPGSWWRKTARPAVNRARDAGLVTFHEGKKTYSWVA